MCLRVTFLPTVLTRLMEARCLEMRSGNVGNMSLHLFGGMFAPSVIPPERCKSVVHNGLQIPKKSSIRSGTENGHVHGKISGWTPPRTSQHRCCHRRRSAPRWRHSCIFVCDLPGGGGALGSTRRRRRRSDQAKQDCHHPAVRHCFHDRSRKYFSFSRLQILPLCHLAPVSRLF